MNGLIFYNERSPLYIPHGSDKTRLENYQYWFHGKPLYIPHGSDKTGLADLVTVDILYFISHMVQIKRFLLYLPGYH